MREIVIGKNDAGQRLDRFLRKALPSLPSGKMYKFIRQKDVKLNGKRCEISDRLCEGDVLRLFIPDEFFAVPSARRVPSVPLEKPQIIFEDRNILIALKPAGLLVHDDDSGEPDTLINRVKDYLRISGEYDPDAENSFAPAPAHRIDRNTEGLVICAKNAESLRELNRLIKARKIKKTYLCVTVGTPREREGEIVGYLEKNSRDNTVTVRKERTPGSKTAVTRYKVLKISGDLSLCEVELVTGRTHQIRAHMAYIGCPLLGDGKYCRNEPNRKYKEKSQLLCAYKLCFEIDDAKSPLKYLSGREFRAPEPGFIDKYFK